MLVREELGLDPDELGSPWGAAGGSFVAFAIGAVIPVIPYLFGGGTAVLLVSLGLSLVALFAVGAAVSLLTGRGLIFSGLPPARDRSCCRARDLRDRLDHRRLGRGLMDGRRLAHGCATRASTQGRWSNGPGDRYAAHDHGYDKVIVVERGSIRFGLPATGDVDRSRGGRPARAAGRHRA